MELTDCMYDYRYEYPEVDSQVLGNCSYCGEKVTDDECRYELDDDVLLHEDCLTSYMCKYYKE